MTTRTPGSAASRDQLVHGAVGGDSTAATPHAVLGVVVISAAYWRKIRLEEQNLRVAFGPAYDEYRRQSGALIPWVF